MNRKRYDHDVERDHFNALAHAEGEIWWGSTTKAGIKRLERRASLFKQAVACFNDPIVLELGCGTGAFSQYVLRESPLLHLTACDISPACIKIAAERLCDYNNAKFLVFDVTSKAYSRAIFDAVIGNSVLHHLPLEASLAGCWQALKPGGKIIFFEPNMINPQIFLEKNVRFIGKALQNTESETAFFRWRLKKILSNSGFEKIVVEPFDFLHPLIPPRFVAFFDKLGTKVENIPILKEFSGSLLITAVKP